MFVFYFIPLCSGILLRWVWASDGDGTTESTTQLSLALYHFVALRQRWDNIMRRCFISYIFFINRCGCKRMQAICKKGTSNKMMTRSRLEHYYSYKISLIYFFLKLQLIKEENIRGVVTLNEDYETSIFMHSKEVNHYFMHGPKLLKLNTTTKYEHYNKL